METKRVGMARVRSLINENNNALRFRRADVQEAITGDTTLTAADQGKIILIDASSAGNFTVTLPTAPSLGAEYTFVLAVKSNAAAEVLLDSGVNNKFEGFAVMYKADMQDGTTAFHSHRKLGFGDAAELGSKIHCVCVADTEGAVRWALLDAKSDVAYINAFS